MSFSNKTIEKSLRQQKTLLLFAVVFLLIGSIQLPGQTTGKITGVITDAQNGEALVGVNVLIEGTILGATSDGDGYYVILNAPPGNHTLHFEYIGYSALTVTDLLVNIDRTTTYNAKLSSATVDIGTEVTVEAERPIVEIDKTFSSTHYGGDEVEDLPVEGLRNVMELSPGINRNANGTISVRGGGEYEVNFNVNGIKSLNTNTGIPAYGTGDKAENSWKYDINPLAVQQLEVVSGGFNAEYGNAQSGVVNVVMKDGGATFNGGFIAEYRPAGQYHWGDYIYSKQQFEWNRWGNVGAWYPYYQNDTTGAVNTAAAQRNYELWAKNHTPSDDNILGAYDYTKDPYTRYLFSFGGPLGKNGDKVTFFFSGEMKNKPTRLPTVERVQELDNYSLVLSFKPHPSHQFKLTGLYQNFLSGMGSGSDDIRWSGLWGIEGAKRKYTLVYDSPREETVFAQGLSYKFIASPRSYLEATITHQRETLYALQTPTPATAKDVRLPENDRVLEDPGPWFEKYRPYFTWSRLYNQASITDYWEGKMSFSSQLSKTNLLKIGIESWTMDQNYNASSSLAVSAFIWRNGFATNYKAKTWYSAGYVQDKLEFAGMVANLGARLDAYNFGADVPVDRYRVFYPATGSEDVGNPETEPAKTRVTVSPRAGISFPIAEKTAFRVQYGHFRSMPSFNQALDNQTYNGWGSYGNPNLKPKLSINYEVGLQHNLWDTHQLDIVTYYNDLKDQISVVYVDATTGSVSAARPLEDLQDTYLTYENNGYGNSQGVEVTFRNRTDGRWRYQFSYAISQTKNGNFGSRLIGENLSDITLQRTQYSAADFLAPEDRSGRFNMYLTYAMPKHGGFRWLGVHPLENFSMSVIYRVSSGVPYFWAPDFQFQNDVSNNRRYPLESQTDLRLEKKLRWLDYDFTMGMRILNLFDNKHLTPISGSEELDRWVLRGATYADADNNPVRDVRLYNYFQVYKNIPRQVFFSFGMQF